MKKAICILMALLMVTGTLAGCGKETASETTAGTTAFETTAEESTTAAPVLTDEQIQALSAPEFSNYLFSVSTEGLSGEEAEKKISDLKARQFLNYMKNKRVDDIAFFTDGVYTTADTDWKYVTNEAYMIFNKIDIDSYDILPSDTSPSEFTVVMNISKSEIALFPVGTSRWILNTKDAQGAVITLFKNINDTSVELYRSNSVAADLCYMFTYCFGRFKTMDDFNKLVPDVKDKASFNWFCDRLVPLLLQNRDGDYSEKAFPVKRSEVEALAKKTFGITKIDFKRYSVYNSADDTIGSSEYGGTGYTAALSGSTYDQDTRIRTLVLNYYSDAAYFLIAKTMEYTLRENTDGSLTLLSARLVYDSGYEMWKFST